MTACLVPPGWQVLKRAAEGGRMKSFADVKRRFAPGVILECIENTYRPVVSGTFRKIERVQTNAIACTMLTGTEVGKGLFWTYFPKAKDVEIVGPDTFRLKFMEGRSVTLRFVENPT